MRQPSRKPTPKASVRELALGLLARREHGRAELMRKLAQRGYGASEVAPVLDVLAEQGLLSEARYVASYVRSRAERGYGPLRILAELRQRGALEPVVREVLDGCGEPWRELAGRYYQRHFSGPPTDYRERARRWRHMQQRGFDADTLATVLDDEGDGDAV
ncbi:hypothetical protein BI364_13375 [Acidihalobacter yilgarnensis]|uniref:Regulatory protein RecX n=2 Tax=Acidihalobacter yilgarnensis TaxID=2819280 RepID=A0A1D8IQR0_9GAMM|nr:hypothetical protein BI364_13375 [Acidihalobacter yilgarnensis]